MPPAEAVCVLRSPANLGIGGAVQTGYLWAPFACLALWALGSPRLLGWGPVAYDGGTPDFVVLDRGFPTATQDFLRRFPNVEAMIARQSGWCTAFTDERFTVFARRCPEVR